MTSTIKSKKSKTEFTKRLKKMDDILEKLNKIEGYDYPDILQALIDSICIELTQELKNNGEEDKIDKAINFGEKVVKLGTEEFGNKDFDVTDLQALMLALSSSFISLFDTIGGMNEENECRECDCPVCKKDYKALSKLFKDERIDLKFLVRMLENGDITLNDIQEHFGNEVALQVLTLATKSLNEDSSKEDLVKKEIEDFHTLKVKVADGKENIGTLTAYIDNCSDEAKKIIAAEANSILDKYAKSMGLTRENTLNLINILMN